MKQFVIRAIGATRLALKANAPTIMVAGGVVAMGAGAVIACKQTLKVEEVMAEYVPELEQIERGRELNLAGYTAEHARNDRIKVYTKVSLDMGKLYAVPTVLFVSGAGLVFGGHRIMVKRNATLALAFTGLKKTLDAYRQNVRNEFGDKADQAMLTGHVVKEVVDPVSGQTEVVRVRDWEGAKNDPYNRIFGEGESTQWEPDLGINKMFVANQQRMANILLNQRGHLYLSEVYQSLGFQETDISRVCGWKVQYLPDGSRDIPFVDFGIDKALPDDWKYDREHAIYLDFNCTGLIVGGKIQKILEQA